MEKSFVDKVYDAYIKEDYSYGDNNLNPKHEIRKVTLKDTDDQLNKILAAIQRKVTQISMKYSDDTFKLDDSIGNFGGDGKSVGTPSSVREAIHKAGGSGDNLVMIPSMDGDASPLMGEVEIAIAKILATIGSTSDGGDENAGIGDAFGTSGLDLFDINCNGSFNAITGSEINEDVDDNSDENDESEDDDNINSSNNSGGNGFDIEDDDSDDNDDETTDSSGDTVDAVMEDAVNEALAKMDEDILNDNTTARECAMKDLGLMKAFLMILKIIQAIKKAMNPLMNILYDTVRIVVLAAGCWNNPTNIGEIIQRIIIKLIAILIMIIAMLVQMFWEMLGLDCLTAEAKDVIDQIKQALTGVTSTYNKVERLAMSFGANVMKAQDAFEEARAALEEVQKNMTTDHIKEMFNLKEMSRDIWEKGIGGVDGLKQSGMSALQSTGAYDDIMSTIESVNDLRKTAEKTIDSLMKSKGGEAANQTVRKIASQLHNVEVH